ncbi:MAG: DUF3943 domain-containing protein [Acidobacteria bacterium]|nr:DUF3943 domain-containing protein [Acidobacteriota bacterium]
MGTNLVLHPIQGSTLYQIARTHGASHAQAFWWGLAYSTQFELGPVFSEAMIGNVPPSPVDLVITPFAGFYLGRVEEWLEPKVGNLRSKKLRQVARTLLVGKFLAAMLRKE